MRLFPWALLGVCLVGCCQSVSFAAARDGLRAGVARADITPARLPYLAGYAINRKALDVHDPITATALVLDYNGERVALVSVDLIGLFRPAILQIRRQVKLVPAARVHIAATHTHSGPDSMGMWGPDMLTSGVDKVWYAGVKDRLARLVDEAAENLTPAECRVGAIELTGVAKNWRIDVMDNTLTALQLRTREGKPLATVVNYAVHPEVMNRSTVTADMVHFMRQEIETRYGGLSVFLNGALGGMVSPDPRKDADRWAECERLGRIMGDHALRAVDGQPWMADLPIRQQSRVFRVPLENPRFILAHQAGVFAESIGSKTHEVTTEVHRLTLGPLEIVTMPGEVFPALGLQIRGRMKSAFRMPVGLCNDELGYIMPESDFGLKLYRYESSVSVGPLVGPRMMDAVAALCGPREITRYDPSSVLAVLVQDLVDDRFRGRKLNGTLRMRVTTTGQVQGTVYVTVADGAVRCSADKTREPVDVGVTADIADLAAIASGRLDPLKALTGGKISVEGDITKLMLMAMF